MWLKPPYPSRLKKQILTDHSEIDLVLKSTSDGEEYIIDDKLLSTDWNGARKGS
jgi:hypothetical protein